MANITITITTEVAERDPLQECIGLLRRVAQRYPQHLSIAYHALESEASLPTLQELSNG